MVLASVAVISDDPLSYNKGLCRVAIQHSGHGLAALQQHLLQGSTLFIVMHNTVLDRHHGQIQGVYRDFVLLVVFVLVRNKTKSR